MDAQTAKYTLKQVLKRRLQASLLDFVRYFWDVVVPQDRFVNNWHIEAICTHLQALAEGKLGKHRLLIFLPPRHAKSIIINVFMPAWDWCNRPHRRFLSSAGKANLAERDATKARDLISHPRYQELFGDIVTPADPNKQEGAWGKGWYQTRQGGSRLAITTSGGTGQDADFLLCDDPLEAQDARSQAMRDNVYDWYCNTFTTRGVQAEKTPLVLVHQRLHEDDIAGRILANPDMAELYDVLCFPAEYEHDHPVKTVSSLGFVDPRTTEGELLWPSRFGEAWAKGEKAKGARHYNSQLQQRPSVANGEIFKDYMFPITEERAIAISNVASEVVLSVDATFSDSTNSDYVAILVFAKKAGVWHCIDGVNKQMDFLATLDAINVLMGQYRPTELLIEKKANGDAIIRTLRSKGIENIQAITPKEGKEARAEASTVYLSGGHVQFVQCPIVDKLIDQALAFPNAKHDDLVDALTQFVNAKLIKRQTSYELATGGF